MESGLDITHLSDLGGAKEVVIKANTEYKKYWILERMCQEYLGVFKLAAPNA